MHSPAIKPKAFLNKSQPSCFGVGGGNKLPSLVFPGRPTANAFEP